MQRDKVIILVIFILAAVAVVGLQFIGGHEINTVKPEGHPIADGLSPKSDRVMGIALQLHNPGDQDHPYEKFIDEISSTGANMVYLVVAGYQENCASESIFIEARKTPSHDKLRGLIRHARSRGLKVGVMPIVLLENPRNGEWRGKIAPKDFDRWWEKYSEFIMHYAYLCNEMRVELFMVGSELNYLENRTSQWKQLIARVKGAYDGIVGYSANWDHYRVPQFWDDLDFIGMTTYYDLTGGKKPTIERLKDAWKPIRAEILDWQKKNGKPIIFTEVGWPNQPTCAEYPWNYFQSQKTDPTAQANCFEAFFATWINEPSVGGFIVWEWRKREGVDCSPQTDNSYVPYRKPAIKVISRYFNGSSRPESDTTQPQFIKTRFVKQGSPENAQKADNNITD